jgi:hypothetical protein
MKYTKKTCFKDSNIIRASEIGQFCYCSIAWYLQKCGYEPKSPMLEIGIKKHENLGKIIQSTQVSSKKSKTFAIAGYSILIFGLLIILFEVIL